MDEITSGFQPDNLSSNKEGKAKASGRYFMCQRLKNKTMVNTDNIIYDLDLIKEKYLIMSITKCFLEVD